MSHRKSNSVFGAIALTCVAAVTIASCSSSGSSKSGTDGGGSRNKLTTVTLAIPTPSPNPVAAFLPAGVELGYFRKQGINLEIKYIAGGTAVTSAVQAGQVQLGYINPEPLVEGVAQGSDFISVYQLLSVPIYYYGFIPGRKVQSIGQLSGTKIGVVSVGNVASYVSYINADLKKDGRPLISPSNFIAIGDGASAVAAVKSGRVDALFATDSTMVTLENAGLDIKEQALQSLPQGYPGSVLMARKGVVEKNRAALRSTMAAMTTTYKYCVSNPSGCMDAFAKAAPESVADRSLANAVWARRAKLTAILPNQTYGKSTDANWTIVINELLGTGDLKKRVAPSSLYTNSLLP